MVDRLRHLRLVVWTRTGDTSCPSLLIRVQTLDVMWGLDWYKDHHHPIYLLLVAVCLAAVQVSRDVNLVE